MLMGMSVISLLQNVSPPRPPPAPIAVPPPSLVLGFGIGAIFVILVVAAAALAVTIWAVIDALRTPEATWRAASHSRQLWIAILGVGIVFGYGLIASLIYLFGVRPTLRRAATASL